MMFIIDLITNIHINIFIGGISLTIAIYYAPRPPRIPGPFSSITRSYRTRVVERDMSGFVRRPLTESLPSNVLRVIRIGNARSMRSEMFTEWPFPFMKTSISEIIRSL